MIQRVLRPFAFALSSVGSAFGFVLHFFAGFFCCWTPFTAPLLAGWMNRYMLRSAVHVWVRRSNVENPKIFFQNHEFSSFRGWPRWSDVSIAVAPSILKTGFFRKAFNRFIHFFRSLWWQYRSGLLSLFNTWLLTLPFALVWLWMWWAGWNNTFSRGYEEEGLAPLTFIFSAFGFCLVMLYVPIAQARQAIHGKWASFFDMRAVRTISRHVRFRLLILAVFYALGSLGLIGGTKIFPTMFEEIYDLDMSNIQSVKDMVFVHFLFVILCFYCGLLFVKRMNARVYAIGVLKALQAKDLSPEDLSPFERTLLLERLSFAPPKPKIDRPWWVRLLIWPLRKLWTFTLVALTLSVWGGVAFSLYFGQFMNLSHVDWLNQPMIQMPYIRVPEVQGG